MGRNIENESRNLPHRHFSYRFSFYMILNSQKKTKFTFSFVEQHYNQTRDSTNTRLIPSLKQLYEQKISFSLLLKPHHFVIITFLLAIKSMGSFAVELFITKSNKALIAISSNKKLSYLTVSFFDVTTENIEPGI
jgi:hypothetical protein